MKFGLTFSDVKEYKNSPYRRNDHTLSFEESSKLMDGLDKELKALSDLAEAVVAAFESWSNPDSSRLDNMTITDWLASYSTTPGKASPTQSDPQLEKGGWKLSLEVTGEQYRKLKPRSESDAV